MRVTLPGQVRSGARENLPSDHDTAQAKGELSKAPIRGDFHVHEHRKMCVLLRESSIRWRQRLWQLRNGQWGADCSTRGQWAEDVFLPQADVGAVCPSPLVAYRVPNFFLNSSLWLLLRLRYHWSMSFGFIWPHEAKMCVESCWSSRWTDFHLVSSLGKFLAHYPFLKDIKITEFCLDVLFYCFPSLFAPLSLFYPTLSTD